MRDSSAGPCGVDPKTRPISNTCTSRRPWRRFARRVDTSPGITRLLRSAPCSSDRGFARRSRGGAWGPASASDTNEELITSVSPTPTSASRTPRTATCAGRRPSAPRDEGTVDGIRSTPTCRPTSSMRSASRPTSLRQEGISTSQAEGGGFTPKPRPVRICRARSSATGVPSTADARASRKVVTRRARGTGRRSMSPGRAVPAPIFASRWAMRAVASGGASASAPRSKRCEASVCIPRVLLARRIESGSHQAASRATVRVSSETSLEAPPMIPASASAPSVPATTPTRPDRMRPTPSSVVRRSPSRAQRTMSLPSGTRARSKAWDGCPISIIT